MTENPVATLLQQHLNGADVTEQIAALTHDDPQLRQITQLLANREHQLQAELESHEQDEFEQQQREQEQEHRRERVQSLRRHLDQLTQELERLHGTLDVLAGALGACPTCLGYDPGCPLCHGRGQPGSLPPDPDSFDQIVLPAVRARTYLCSRTGRGRDVDEKAERSTA